MSTYIMCIEGNLNKISLKDYTVKYASVLAFSPEDAKKMLENQYGENFTVSLISIKPF